LTAGAAGNELDEAYAALGLERGATLEQVQSRFRERVLSVHPDKGGSNEEFIRAHWAYRTLVDGLDEWQEADEEADEEAGAGDADMEGVLSHDEVREMIGDADPPEATRAALHHRVACLASYRVLPRVDPKSGPRVEDADLDARIVTFLKRRKIARLYAYQHEAIRQILGGKSVVIEAPTAFGKTEAFLVPIAQLASGMPARGVLALLVYPTKALGRDQLPKIDAVAGELGMRAAIFDGSTTPAERDSLEANPPEFLVTNFDLIHHQMFRQGHLARMLRTVRFLVVDETHYYAGAFGANAHHIISRLRRLTGDLQCVGASATLNASGEFCTALFGQDVGVIREDGRRATVDMAMMSPPEHIPRHRLMVNLAKILVSHERKILAFSNTHRNSELVGGEAMADGLRAEIHRGGMGEARLERIEAEFRGGGLDMLSCTPTLELGMDIGDVDGVVSEGVPANRFMQRIGRAGREGNRGCAFLVLGRDPISRYYLEHPDEYMHDEWIPHIDVANEDVEDVHTVAAALDRPLSGEYAMARTGPISRCAEAGWLERVGEKWLATAKGRRKVEGHSVRGIERPVRIRLDGRMIGMRSLPMALSELHEGAIYMLGGRPYRVERLAYPRKKVADVVAMPRGTGERTRALGHGRVTHIGTTRSREFLGTGVELCRLRVMQTVNGYLHYTGQEAEYRGLDRQLRHSFETKGIRFGAAGPPAAAGGEEPQNADQESSHAIAHLVANASRMIAGAAEQDVDGMLGEDGLIYIYDNARGGNGIAGILYGRMERVLRRAYDIVATCPCRRTGGCPRCILSYRCDSSNAGLHKAGAMESLERMLAGDAARDPAA